MYVQIWVALLYSSTIIQLHFNQKINFKKLIIKKKVHPDTRRQSWYGDYLGENEVERRGEAFSGNCMLKRKKPRGGNSENCKRRNMPTTEGHINPPRPLPSQKPSSKAATPWTPSEPRQIPLKQEAKVHITSHGTDRHHTPPDTMHSEGDRITSGCFEQKCMTWI